MLPIFFFFNFAFSDHSQIISSPLPRLSKLWGSLLGARQEPEWQHVADVKVEDDGDLAKDQELVLSVSLAGQLDLTNKLSVAGSALAEFLHSRT